MAYEQLNQILCDNIEVIFQHFQLDAFNYGKYYTMACPIHGGAKKLSLSIYPEGNYAPGYYICRSHHCEQTFKKTAIGFVRGILSHLETGWSKPGDEMYGWGNTLKYIAKLFKLDLNKLDKGVVLDKSTAEKHSFTKNIEGFNKKAGTPAFYVSRSDLEHSLEIPASYFLSRNFREETLKKFCIGLCSNPAKPFYNRVVVPVFNDVGTHAIGCLGRTIYGLCGKCNLWHIGQRESCPAEYSVQHCKWRNQKDFSIGEHLYNFWNVKNFVRATKTIVLTESVGNVLRLEEAGVYNAVAMFTNNLSEIQQMKLETSGAMSIVPIMDNDEAGREGLKLLQKKLGRIFDIAPIFPLAQFNDVADMPADAVKDVIGKHVSKVANAYNFNF